MELVLLLLGFPSGPDLARLGSDDWRTREAEHRRCDNLLFALALPARHPDPEVDRRVKEIRTRHLKHFSPRYIEAVTHRTDFPRWLDLYFVPGRSRLDLDDVYTDLAEDPGRVRELGKRWELPCFEWPPIPHLMERHEFRDFCDYHWHRAPAPREK